MTKWADPIGNPEQNSRYRRERNRNLIIFGVAAVGSYVLFLIALFAGWLP